jgi:hypothetical protein
MAGAASASRLRGNDFFGDMDIPYLRGVMRLIVFEHRTDLAHISDVGTLRPRASMPPQKVKNLVVERARLLPGHGMSGFGNGCPFVVLQMRSP